jgi:type IV secretion system protein VirB10
MNNEFQNNNSGAPAPAPDQPPASQPLKAGIPGQGTFSSVSMTASSKKFTAIGMIISAGALMYYTITSSTAPSTPQEEKKQRQVELQQKSGQILEKAQPVVVSKPEVSEVDLEKSKTILDLPTIKEPTPPPPPLIIAPQAAPGKPGLEAGNFFDSKKSVTDEQLAQRRQARIIVVGGSGNKGEAEDNKDEKGGKSEGTDEAKGGKGSSGKPASPAAGGFLGFSDTVYQNSNADQTSTQQVKATKIGDTNNIIAQGKLIHAILETAINTDLPGSLRAIITRDIYGESGKNILIPKGSRVVGTYDHEVKAGQTRVVVKWDRLIRPDGVDIALDAGGTDELGRSGVMGHVDNKFWLKLGTAILVSYVIPVTAKKLSNIKDSTIVETNNGDGTTTTTSNTGSQQLKQSTDEFSKVAKATIEETFSTKPTITIDQGSRINIFVQKDLVFPAKVSNQQITLIK